MQLVKETWMYVTMQFIKTAFLFVFFIAQTNDAAGFVQKQQKSIETKQVIQNQTEDLDLPGYELEQDQLAEAYNASGSIEIAKKDFFFFRR